MDNDSLSFGYKEIKLNPGWEGQGGEIKEAIRSCAAPNIFIYILHVK